jgi:UDP-3-O-[3-hydroxymyristoyl] glucosamine N-acyltransferase
MKLGEIAARLGCRIDAASEGTQPASAFEAYEIERVSGIEQAGPGDLTFVANPKYQAQLATTRASAVIVSVTCNVPTISAAVLRCDHPYLAFARVVAMLADHAPPAPGVDRLSSVATDATLGADVSIGAFVTIGAGAAIGARTIIYPNVVIGPGATVGEDCVLHSQVSVRERVAIGHRVVLQDGVVLGSDGFGFVKQADGTHLKIPQHAAVVIEDDVEIGANTTIDRPAVGETRIGAGTKIDNLVQVAHGVTVGRRVLFAAQVGIAGSTVVEDDVVLAGQVGVAGHIRIGKGVIATAQTGVPNSIDAGAFVSGYPAIANRDWLKSAAIFRNLPDMKKRIADLEQRIKELEEKLQQCLPAADR